MFDLEKANQDHDLLCDWVEQQTALNRMSPGYINDPVDVDREGCFVFKYSLFN